MSYLQTDTIIVLTATNNNWFVLHVSLQSPLSHITHITVLMPSISLRRQWTYIAMSAYFNGPKPGYWEVPWLIWFSNWARGQQKSNCCWNGYFCPPFAVRTSGKVKSVTITSFLQSIQFLESRRGSHIDRLQASHVEGVKFKFQLTQGNNLQHLYSSLSSMELGINRIVQGRVSSKYKGLFVCCCFTS